MFQLATVEILDTSSSQWYTAQSLPVGCESMASVVLSDKLYLIGGKHLYSSSNKVFSVSFPAFIAHTTSRRTPTTRNPAAVPTWEILSGTPMWKSAFLATQNSLLALGGRDGKGDPGSSIHIYDPVSKVWAKVGDMPVRRSSSTCLMLNSGELLVLGGWGDHVWRSYEVYKVTLSHETL